MSDIIGRAGAGGRHFRVGVIVPAAIVAVVAAVALLVPRAGDVAVPTTIDVAMAADATPKCLAGGGAGTARLVVQDQRGPTAALLFVQGEDLVLCVASRGSTGSIDAAASGHRKPSTATGELAVVGGMTSPSGTTYPGLRVVVSITRRGSLSRAAIRAAADGLLARTLTARLDREPERRPFRLTLCSQYAVIATGLTQVEVTPVLVVKALTEYSSD